MRRNKNFVRSHRLQLGKMAALLVFTAVLSGCTIQEKQEKQQETETVSVQPVQDEPLQLPRAFRYAEEELPAIRDQKNTNQCWAYASLSALESSRDEDGGAVYSAGHLLENNPFRTEGEQGGNHVMAMGYFLSWLGPVRESAENFLTEPSVHVQEIRMSRGKDYEALKRFVWLYGGVETEIYADANGNLNESPYYNSETCAYCYTGEEASNHAVVIIGWDDDYPAENFAGSVKNDGAFLCRNSWGEGFGQEGNFYISYEDVCIGKDAAVYSRVDAADNYDLIYQSDLCGYTAQIGYGQEECWFANVYSAGQDISVRAAGFYATDKNTAYTVYIVPDFQGEDSLKERILVTAGDFTDAGYYTVDFPEAVRVEAGKEFAVVVRVHTEYAVYPVAAELPAEAAGDGTEGFGGHIDISDGRGYLSLKGNSWEHVEKTNQCNICLKAYADLR